MKNSRGWLAVAAVLSVSLAACAPGGGSASSSGSGDPIRIAYMGVLSGPNAIPGSTHAFELAVKQINDAGGINGRKVEFKTFDTDITPEGASRATSLAMQYQPTAMVGYSVSSGLKASIPSIKAAGVPVVHSTLGSLTSAKNLDYDGAFRMSPTTSQYAEAATQYLTQDLHAKSILMIHTQDAAPTEGMQAAMGDAQQKGFTITERAVPPTVTDVTEPVLAARNADAIFSWGYPTTDALVVKQAAQNNVAKPIMTFSVASAVVNGLVPTNLITKDTLNVSNCAAPVLNTPKSQQYVADYTKAYGVMPQDYLESRNYDAMFLLKAAIEKAGSTDGPKVTAALKTVGIDGACGTIKSDDKNNLYQDVAIESWAGAKPALAKIEQNLPTDF